MRTGFDGDGFISSIVMIVRLSSPHIPFLLRSFIFLTENLFPNNFARVAPYQATLFDFQPPRDLTCALDLHTGPTN